MSRAISLCRDLDILVKRPVSWDPGSCDQALTVSCIVTQFARETFGIYRDVILNRSMPSRTPLGGSL